MASPDFPMPENYNRRQIDPALLTFDEYMDIIDKKRTCHPNSAYDLSLKQLNQYSSSKTEFPKVIRRFRRHGLDFEVRIRFEKIGRRVKTTPDGDVLRIDGEIQYYSDEETKRLGWQQFEWTLAVFEGDTKVGVVQDEWGCVLVMVAQEYRSFGLGPLLLKLAYSIQPDKPSGGFTPSGWYTMQKVYREFVGDALRNGMYRKLVQQGSMTLERVRTIMTSARYKPSTAKPDYRLDSSPQDWMLYVGENGDFAVYDKKLREIINEGDRLDYFADRMIKGLVYVQVHDGKEVWALLRAFGADSPTLKRFLINCAIEYCQREDAVLYLEEDEPSLVDPAMASLGPESKVRGFSSRKVLPTGKRLDYDGMATVEARWRRSFDRYDEFRIQMLEMAYAKFQHH